MKKISFILLAILLTFTLMLFVGCDNTDDQTPSSADSSTISSTPASKPVNSTPASTPASRPESPQASTPSSTVKSEADKIPAEGIWKDAIYRNDTELGQGAKSFTLIVLADGKEVIFSIKTDKSTVGDALEELGLVDGTRSEATGLYIKKANGMVADWDIDKTYWSFYINGEYAMTGASQTDITEGATYKLSRES